MAKRRARKQRKKGCVSELKVDVKFGKSKLEKSSLPRNGIQALRDLCARRFYDACVFLC